MANKSFDDEYFKSMIVGYLKKFGPVKRSTIDNLIIPKLSAVLTDKQKKNKVTNYLSALRMDGIIVAKPGFNWELV
jgi:ATP-dependent DNA helicase RecG